MDLALRGPCSDPTTKGEDIGSRGICPPGTHACPLDISPWNPVIPGTNAPRPLSGLAQFSSKTLLPNVDRTTNMVTNYPTTEQRMPVIRICDWNLVMGCVYVTICVPVEGLKDDIDLVKGKKMTGGFPGGSVVKNSPAIQETCVQSLGWEDPLEEGMATHSSILAWEIPRTEETGGL